MGANTSLWLVVSIEPCWKCIYKNLTYIIRLVRAINPNKYTLCVRRFSVFYFLNSHLIVVELQRFTRITARVKNENDIINIASLVLLCFESIDFFLSIVQFFKRTISNILKFDVFSSLCVDFKSLWNFFISFSTLFVYFKVPTVLFTESEM